jgi:hypothetical protein
MAKIATGPASRTPLLLRFKEPISSLDLSYDYDPGRQLNLVRSEQGAIPAVRSPDLATGLKTVGTEGGEDP